ncbi:acetyl-CoA acetyltransferase [Sulfodiicoccus acidiphilus]|uniref:Acetyl-CoA acetyltransferase n=1 Tax=Sulfodiicoccus acidiphilus TaxID=1670455 RepID=A0A348B4Y8_9CREN|nr:thiolase family protein [Sulfodiicoccus acidiphilus]BBD73240.1 acetyl-CoA acetyltransferase [Sulfodiicoccus acidiphilus]GGT89680.1 acetyl-CoA acetyltransferase [Sulfodiicoccus acidiphilus]
MSVVGFAGSVHKKYEGSAFDLANEVVDKALDSAGMERKDVDGLVSTFLPGVWDGATYRHFFTNQLRQALNIKAKYVDVLDFGGASAMASIYRAHKAVKGGEADVVLCLVGGKGSEVRSRGVTVDSIDRVEGGVALTPFDWLLRTNVDLNPVTDYALVAARHSKLFGTTDQQRALIAVYQRFNAGANPTALYRDPLTVEGVLSSPTVSWPLHLLEVVYPVDGFHAFLVSRRSSKMRSVEIKGYGEAHWHELPPEMPDIVTTPAAESSRQVREFLHKVDALELYDSFTVTVMLQLEDIGVVEKGKVGSFLERTDLTYKGTLPTNTGGGSLNVGQPAYMSGGVVLEEALLQLNDMAGHRNVGARNVLTNGIGGWSRSHSVTLVLGT